MDSNNSSKIISFKDLEKKYKNEQNDDKEERKLKVEANYIFNKALREKDSNLAYEYANNAYEIDQSKYEYRVYAISKLDDENRKLREYQALYEEINNLISAFTANDAILKIYDESEYDKKRYCDLQYNFATTLIKCKKYQEAYEILEKLHKSKTNYRFKVKHLLLNILITESSYHKVLDLYNHEKDDSVLTLIPLSFAYLKLNKYKEFVDTIRHIGYINPKFISFIKKEIDEDGITSAKETYEIASLEEVYFAFKYFLFVYINDSDYFKKIKAILL